MTGRPTSNEKTAIRHDDGEARESSASLRSESPVQGHPEPEVIDLLSDGPADEAVDVPVEPIILDFSNYGRDDRGRLELPGPPQRLREHQDEDSKPFDVENAKKYLNMAIMEVVNLYLSKMFT